jgi:hypothetical protein
LIEEVIVSFGGSGGKSAANFGGEDYFLMGTVSE